MRLEAAGRTDLGRRPNNEDAYCLEPELGLFAVADGMGGYEGGEVASRLAIDALVAFFRRNAEDADATWPWKLDPQMTLAENLLSVAARLGHAAIVARKDGRLVNMGATLAAVAVRDGSAVIAHLGDSRVYRLRQGKLEALTRDHSMWAEMVAAGKTDFRSRSECPWGHVITRALGVGEQARPELRKEPLRTGDVLMVCSDGVSEPVPEDELAAALALPPAQACDELVRSALAHGGKDNITAVVLRVE